MNSEFYFVSDLHGRQDRYRALFSLLHDEPPAALLLGGDLLPSYLTVGHPNHDEFVTGFLLPQFQGLREALGDRYPSIYLILGNDDGRFVEPAVEAAAARGIWHYLHNRRLEWGELPLFGYAFVPPSPFLLKDWERYDVSRYVDPGCIPLDEGKYAVEVTEYEMQYATIAEDLENLTAGEDLQRAVMLFHTPPYQTRLDRAALDGKMVDHVPLDVHVGSIALRRFIEARRPAVTLHGHIHESTRLTGTWHDRIGDTHLFGAAHDGPELAVVIFDPHHPDSARRLLL